jgi:hypothetical protein
MAIRTTRCVAHHHQPASQQAKTNDSGFTIGLSRVLDLQGHPAKNDGGIGKVKASFSPCSVPLGRIEGDAHGYCIYKNRVDGIHSGQDGFQSGTQQTSVAFHELLISYAN